MKKMLPFSIALLVFFASCSKDRLTGSGAIVTEQRTQTNFTQVSTSRSTNVHITQGATFKIEVKGYQNLLPHMETVVRGNTLQIGYEGNVNVKNDNLEVYVTMPLLEGVTTNGSANIDTKGVFTTTTLSASTSGSGNIVIEAGSVEVFKSETAGSGSIKAFGLTAKKADVSISGSGTAEVKATNNLKVNIAGSGTVYYKGQPLIESNISGSGRLEHRP